MIFFGVYGICVIKKIKKNEFLAFVIFLKTKISILAGLENAKIEKNLSQKKIFFQKKKNFFSKKIFLIKNHFWTFPMTFSQKKIFQKNLF